MIDPDAAAALNHDQMPIENLIEADEGAVIEVKVPVNPADGDHSFLFIGTVKVVSPGEWVHIHEEGKSFNTTITVKPGTTYRVLEPAPATEDDTAIAPVDTKLIRELISVSDELKLADGQVTDLKKRQAELSEKLIEQFAANGIDKMSVDGRTSYIHNVSGASFQNRPDDEGGGKYTLTDLVPVLRKIGKPEYIQPETTNWMTVSSLLREYRDNKEEPPPELARMVTLRVSPEVRVKAPSKPRKA